jgi:hypothetical protein
MTDMLDGCRSAFWQGEAPSTTGNGWLVLGNRELTAVMRRKRPGQVRLVNS